MTGFVGRHIAPEMLSLLLLEFGVGFLLASLMVSPAGFAALGSAGVAQAVLIAGALGFVSFMLGIYRPQLFTRARKLLVNTAFGAAIAVPVAWGLDRLLGMHLERLVGGDGLWPAKMLLAWIVAIVVIRLGFLLAVQSRLFVRRVAVLGPMAEVAATVAAVRYGHAGFLEVAQAAGGEGPGAMRRAGVRTVLLAPSEERRLSAAERDLLIGDGIAVETEAAFWERHLKRVNVPHLTRAWFEALDRDPPGQGQLTVNRLGDVVTSLAFLVFTLPLMALVALAVRLESPGPVLYRQERVGLGGRSFVVLKFRSMSMNAEARGPAWAQAHDPRVTRIGAIMRRTRIDELPQLVNILRGEMSFIGPRPERPHFVEQLAEAIPFYRERSRVKPGLTGWAQVNYPYGASIEDAAAKLSYDLFYVRNRSMLLDLSILFATVRVILFQEGSR